MQAVYSEGTDFRRIDAGGILIEGTDSKVTDRFTAVSQRLSKARLYILRCRDQNSYLNLVTCTNTAVSCSCWVQLQVKAYRCLCSDVINLYCVSTLAVRASRPVRCRGQLSRSALIDSVLFCWLCSGAVLFGETDYNWHYFKAGLR